MEEEGVTALNLGEFPVGVVFIAWQVINVFDAVDNELRVGQFPNVGLDEVHEVQDVLDDPCVVHIVVVVESQFIDNEIDSEEVFHSERVDHSN